MNELSLALIALLAVVGMILKNTFNKYPAPSRWLAVGLGIIFVTRLLGWITMTFLSRTLTVENFASAHTVNSLVASASFAIALAFMIAAAFVSRRPNTIPDAA
jgi:cell shape-determining protein MreD